MLLVLWLLVLVGKRERSDMVTMERGQLSPAEDGTQPQADWNSIAGQLAEEKGRK